MELPLVRKDRSPSAIDPDFLLTIREIPRSDTFGLAFHLDAHRTGGAGNHRGGLLFGECIQVLHLGAADLEALLPGDGANLRSKRVGGALLDTGSFLEQDWRRRALDDEGKRLVAVYRDYHGQHEPHTILRGSVKLLAELHDIYTLLAECRADGRRRVGLSGLDLKLDVAFNFFCHSPSRGANAGPSRPSAGPGSRLKG